MATILLHPTSGVRYLLLGTGYGAFASETPGKYFGSLAPDKTRGIQSMLAVCAPSGAIGWFASHELVVSTIDDASPREILEGTRGVGTVVQEQGSGHAYVLLGAGFGMYASAAPHVMLGNHAPNRSQGTYAMIAASDVNGRVGWLTSTQLQVIKVDGREPAQLLTAQPAYR